MPRLSASTRYLCKVWRDSFARLSAGGSLCAGSTATTANSRMPQLLVTRTRNVAQLARRHDRYSAARRHNPNGTTTRLDASHTATDGPREPDDTLRNPASSAHRWFMEMFVDSSEWVMGPNVYGMGIFSDGGASRPSPICELDYLLKMSDYKRALVRYCRRPLLALIDKHREFFISNPRLALMPRALDRLDSGRRTRIFAAAEAFLEQHTVA